ncbi:MAG: hypothetical protein R2704_06915 [Microthrixaceae bacterium]
MFFLSIAGAAVVALLASLFMVEPEASFATELLVDDDAPVPADDGAMAEAPILTPSLVAS